jgi:hypothetical protein
MSRKTRASNATAHPGRIVAPAPRRSSAQVSTEKAVAAKKKANALAEAAKKIATLAEMESMIDAGDQQALDIPRPSRLGSRRTLERVKASKAEVPLEGERTCVCFASHTDMHVDLDDPLKESDASDEEFVPGNIEPLDEDELFGKQPTNVVRKGANTVGRVNVNAARVAIAEKGKRKLEAEIDKELSYAYPFLTHPSAKRRP